MPHHCPSPPSIFRSSRLLRAGVLAFGLAAAHVAIAEPLPPPAESDPPSLFDQTTDALHETLRKGLALVGVNYRRGGTDPSIGLDCSGYVQLVFREAVGLILPRTAKEMSQVGGPVDRVDLKPGDLVFFNTLRRAFSHVGIYLGNSKFMHAPRPGGSVRIEDLGTTYWARRYNGARRVLETP